MAEALEFEELDVQEAFFERGWTDGLPIVPPTPDRVKDMLDEVLCEDPDTLIGFLPARGRGVTMEKAAINAVMAGCKPDYFPVVVAALEAMFDEAFNLHTVLTSTGGAALCAIVSGPIADEIGMNARHNVLGQGNRANATIGRALRLVGMNVLGSKPGESDASSFGHPGKFTLCFAEDPPPAPWRPLRMELGYFEEDTTVTMVPVEGPHQLAQQLTDSAHEVLRSFATSIRHPDLVLDRQGRPRRAPARPRARGLLHRRGDDAGRRARLRLRAGAGQPRGAAGRGRPDRGERPARHARGRGREDRIAARAGRRPARDRRRRGRGLVGLAAGLGADHPCLPRDTPRPPRGRAAARVRARRLHRALDEMSKITVLRPDEPAPQVASVALAPRRELPERPVIGVISNGKPLAKELLDALVLEFSLKLGREVDVERLAKPSAAYVISAEEADVMAVRAHVIISGLGD